MSTQEYEKARDEVAKEYSSVNTEPLRNHKKCAFKMGFDSGASYRLKEIIDWLRSTNIFLSMYENDEIADEIEKKFGGGNE